MSPALAGRFFTTSATWEAPLYIIVNLNLSQKCQVASTLEKPSIWVKISLINISKEPLSNSNRIRTQGHRWEGNWHGFRTAGWMALLTCSSSTVDHSLRSSRSEMSSFSTWPCWTSSASATAKLSRVFFSTSSNFCSSLCSSLSRMLLSWLNSVCILCLSVWVWYCKVGQGEEGMNLSAG